MQVGYFQISKKRKIWVAHKSRGRKIQPLKLGSQSNGLLKYLKMRITMSPFGHMTQASSFEHAH